MYQILLDGIKYGHYNPNIHPKQTAKKMGKKLYELYNMKGTQRIEITFCLNRVKADGGDKIYNYVVTVYPVPEMKMPREDFRFILEQDPKILVEASKTDKALANFMKKYVININDKYILRKFYYDIEKIKNN